MIKNSITLDSVSMHINHKTVILESVSISVPESAFVQIRGASGSGKSTLLHIISGLLTPSSGKLFLYDSLANDPNVIIPPNKRGISLLFQDLALWPHMKGYDQLTLVLGEDDHDYIDSICGQIQLPKKLLSKYPSQLSGGEQQRLAIARALCAKPKILLLDEPFTALDKDNRQALISYLETIRNKITIIYVSHELTSTSITPDITYHLADKSITSD